MMNAKRPAHLLIVDDDPIVSDSISEMLQRAGHHVATAGDGHEALAILREAAAREHTFQLVITDLNMPRIGGLDLLKQIRKQHPATLVVVITGYGTIETAVEKLATAPAKAFSLDAGTLAVGAPADVTILDPRASWEVDPSRFRSKSRNTPFAGWKVKGRVTTTLVSGRVVFTLDRPER